MTIKTIEDENFNHYKNPSMVIAFPHCTFKCEKECGIECCQNSTLFTSSSHEIPISSVIERYLDNNLTSAIVLAGLEPMDDFDQLLDFIIKFREISSDDIVIYTGYYKTEVEKQIKKLSIYNNIIVKFGRYIPNQQKHMDDVLGVELASKNQYAERIN